jgi:predicted nuclease of predicted toxin-antitoxin system
VPDAVRFVFDNHLPNVVADELRRRGVDVQTAHEAGRSRLPDDELIRLATADARVVVTHDQDYLTYTADFQTRGEDFAGIVYCDAEKYVNQPGRLLKD